MESTNATPNTVIVIELTKEERKKLKAVLSNYGRLGEAARKTGLHVNTIRGVKLRGSGTIETIGLIRKYLANNIEAISE